MTALRQLVMGIFGAMISGLLVLGALSVATAEGMIFYTPTAENTPTTGLPIPGEDTATPVPTPTAVPPTSCPPPQGWEAYTLQNGDTLEILSAQRGVSIENIIENNCLLSTSLLPDKILYLPPLPTATSTGTSTATPDEPRPTEAPTDTRVAPTVRPCGNPGNWVIYVVQPGDTLYSLANATGSNVQEVMFANCLSDPNRITVGQRIFLPRLPVRTNTPTYTATRRPPTDTSVPPSNTPVPPSDTPVPEPPTDTPVPPTDTVEPSMPPPARTDLPEP